MNELSPPITLAPTFSPAGAIASPRTLASWQVVALIFIYSAFLGLGTFVLNSHYSLNVADEGFLRALGYSTPRGYGRVHPFVGEVRIGLVEVEVELPELGFAVRVGAVRLTECQMVAQFTGGAGEPARFTRGYGLAFGQSERKAMAMSLVDRALRAAELGEDAAAPAQGAEFVLAHSDNVQATGFVEHLKLPHYVDFQAELDLVRRLRAEHAARAAQPAGTGEDAA